MTCIHYNKVNNIDECNLLHDILNPSKHTKFKIAITLLFYMNVWIQERANQRLKTFGSYWTVNVVP